MAPAGPAAAGAPVMPVLPSVRPAEPESQTQLEPPYHVILHDDDKHSHTYVVLMLEAIFGYEHARGFQLACEVNDSGSAIVATCHKELAELRVDQITTFEHDPSLKNEGPETMKATMEPAE